MGIEEAVFLFGESIEAEECANCGHAIFVDWKGPHHVNGGSFSSDCQNPECIGEED